MINRTIKQFTIATIFIAIIFSTSFLFYKVFIEHKPSCFDGIQNQGELGIDCEGPCEKICQLSFQNIKINWLKSVYVKDNYYDVGAYLTNPNQNHGSGLVKYKFLFYDSADNIIAERTGETFILPNQDKYIIENRIYSEINIVRIDIQFTNKIVWQEFKSDLEIPELFIENKQVYNINGTQGFDRVSGVMHNKSNYDFDKVIVNVIITDQSNQIVALGKTNLNTIIADERRYFLVYWNTIFSSVIADPIIVAETNIFNSDNFMKRWSDTENFYGR